MSYTLLTSAEILAMFTTPKTLVSAPGVGFMIVPVGNPYARHNNSTNYNAVRMLIEIDTATNRLFEIETNFIGATTDKFTIMEEFSSNSPQLVANKGLQVTAESNPTTGTGTIEVWCAYRIIEV